MKEEEKIVENTNKPEIRVNRPLTNTQRGIFIEVEQTTLSFPQIENSANVAGIELVDTFNLEGGTFIILEDKTVNHSQISLFTGKLITEINLDKVKIGSYELTRRPINVILNTSPNYQFEEGITLKIENQTERLTNDEIVEIFSKVADVEDVTSRGDTVNIETREIKLEDVSNIVSETRIKQSNIAYSI